MKLIFIDQFNIYYILGIRITLRIGLELKLGYFYLLFHYGKKELINEVTSQNERLVCEILYFVYTLMPQMFQLQGNH